MAGLHQETDRQQGQHRGTAQHLPQGLVFLGVHAARRLRHRKTRKPDGGEQDDEHSGQQTRAEAVQHRSQRHHGQDETNGPPQPDAAVAVAVRPEVAQGDGLELRQRGVPEETEAGDHQGQRPVSPAPEDCSKGQHRQQRGGTDDGHAPPAVVGDPAPDVGGHQLGGHEDGDQLADLRPTEAPGLKIEAPVGHQRAQAGEIEEIEARQAPVQGHRRDARVSRGRPAPPRESRAWRNARRRSVPGAAASGP